MVEFGYHGEWYTLLIIDIIDGNDLETFVYNFLCEKGLFKKIGLKKLVIFPMYILNLQ